MSYLVGIWCNWYRGMRTRPPVGHGIAICVALVLIGAFGLAGAPLAAPPAADRADPAPDAHTDARVDTLRIDASQVDTLATFDDATVLHRDPRGRLYVLDPERHRLYVLNAAGDRQRTIGGSGSRAGQFSRPAGIDPTNGQTLLVADTGNGRIQRLDADGRPLELLPVSHREEALAPVYRPARDERAPTGTGRPTAVHSTAGDGLALIESDARAVWYLDRQRTLVRRLTPPDVPLARWQPHAIARSAPGDLWIVDAERPQVLITDSFGSIVSTHTAPSDAGPFVDVFATGSAVGLVRAAGITLHDASTYRARQHIEWPATAAPLRRVTASRDTLYLLAGPHLLSVHR